VTVGALALSFGLMMLGPADAERWRPPELQVKERVPATHFEEIRDIAFSYLGRPYVMGGVGSPAFDCSGFTCRVFAEAGYALPRVSRDQARAGRPVDLGHLEPGDLLFFVEEPGDLRIGHVGMYLGGGELVHASSGDGRVEIASLSARWFVERLVAARRILPPPGVDPSPITLSSTTAQPLELVEHTGDFVLPPMLRLPAERPPPSHGPELAGSDQTSVGVRSALVSERQTFGLVLAPEATLRFPSIALSVSAAAPIRFQVGQHPTVGRLSSFGDWTRFVRSILLGLRGADLDLRLSRLGDLTLLDGFIADKIAPGSLASGVPGLTIDRSPLSFFGSVRTDVVRAQALIDDVIDPHLFGAAFDSELLDPRLRVGVAGATDQAAMIPEGKRALDALEASARFVALEDRLWSLSFSTSVGSIRALAETGWGGEVYADAERRFGAYAQNAIRLRAHGGVLGSHFLENVLGPTYLVSRADHLVSLEGARRRGVLGGEVLAALNHFSLGVSYADGVGRRRIPFDRQVGLQIAVEKVPIGGTRLLDLRLAYASRALFSSFGDLAEQVVHGGARVRFTSWFFGELYLERGVDLEGGAGLTVLFTP
jgi:hypothetical protein